MNNLFSCDQDFNISFKAFKIVVLRLSETKTDAHQMSDVLNVDIE